MNDEGEQTSETSGEVVGLSWPLFKRKRSLNNICLCRWSVSSAGPFLFAFLNLLIRLTAPTACCFAGDCSVDRGRSHTDLRLMLQSGTDELRRSVASGSQSRNVFF